MELPYNAELIMRIVGIYFGTFLTTRWSLKQKDTPIILFVVSIVLGLVTNYYIFPVK